MKQHLKTKALDEKALRLSAISGQEQIIYLNVIPTCKCSCKREVILNLKFHMSIVNPLLLQLYTFDWRNKYI